MFKDVLTPKFFANANITVLRMKKLVTATFTKHYFKLHLNNDQSLKL